MPLQKMNKEFTSNINPPATKKMQAGIREEDKNLQTALSRPVHKPDMQNNPGKDFGLAYDRPKKPQPSVYAAKKQVVESMEENSPEYDMAEMVVDGLMHKAFGIKPYAYGMSQHEKDLQKRKEGVNLELQKAHKAIMPALLRSADVNSSDYGQMEPLKKAMGRNPTLFGKIGNIEETGTVPKFNENTGDPNEFAGVPLYSLSYTDPNTGETEQIENTSVPELLEAYHANLPDPDARHLLRTTARKQWEGKIKQYHEDQGFDSVVQVGTAKGNNRPIYRYTTKGGEVNYGTGEMEDGKNVWTPSGQINFTQKVDLSARKQQFAETKYAAQVKKDKTNLNERIFNLEREIAGTDTMGNQNPVSEEHKADALIALYGGEKIPGKVGTAQEGKFMVQVNGKPIDRYGDPLKAKKKTKTNAGLRRKATTRKPAAGLPKRQKPAPMERPKKKETFPRSKIIDPDKHVINTDDFKGIANFLIDSGVKASNAADKAREFLLKKGDQASGFAINQVVKAFKAAVASQAKARKQSFPSSTYGKRNDGTEKGKGFLGELKTPGGDVSTEISIGVSIDGKETEIPTLVPTLTQKERTLLLRGDKPTKEIVKKAVAHAKERIRKGKSPFHGKK